MPFHCTQGVIFTTLRRDRLGYYWNSPEQREYSDAMSTQRILCGWVNLGTTENPPPGSAEAMLAAEAQSARIAHHLPDGSCIAAAGEASISHDGSKRCAAVILGRPRWRDPATAALAREQGHAAAAIARYQEVGTRVLEDLQGGFSLALIDLAQRRSLLAVDRTGIERMCFTRVGPLLVFSTSARAVAYHPAVQATVSGQGIYEYLYCHMVPSPDTVFTGVEKLLPAEQLIASERKVERSFYWAMRFEPDTVGDSGEKADRFRNLLRQAVERQLDERPAGAFLSGGTDSSTVAGILSQVRAGPAQTFSIGFDADGFDELEYARITARHFGTESHEFYVTPDHVAEAMPLIASAYDEPFGNASAVPTYFCARFAKENGVDVMLAGDGGDEFFAGNVRYAKQGIFEHYQAIPGSLRRVLEAGLPKLPFGDALMPIRKAKSYINQAKIPLPERLETYNFLHRNPLQDIFEDEFLKTIDTERPLALAREAYLRAASKEPVDRMMHLDHKVTLADSDLRKVGRMCELAGIDVRYPFLDEDLIDFSGTLRLGEKINGQRLRVFFKDALKDFLPTETIKKSKHGFGLPFGLWLASNGPLQTQVRQALASLGTRGIVRPAYIEHLWREHASGHASYYGVMLWVLAQLELWLQGNALALANAERSVR